MKDDDELVIKRRPPAGAKPVIEAAQAQGVGEQPPKEKSPKATNSEESKKAAKEEVKEKKLKSP